MPQVNEMSWFFVSIKTELVLFLVILISPSVKISLKEYFFQNPVEFYFFVN